MAALLGIAVCASGAWGTTLRIVSYNIDCADQSSDNNITGSGHSLPTVVQAMGLHHIGTNAQPVDVMSCEELQSTTLSNFVAQLNVIYGAGTYAFDPTTDPNTGGGPDGLIYRTNTVQVVSARALKTGSTVLLQSNGTYVAAHSAGSGGTVPRAPMVYQLRPIGSGTNNDFYMYVSHARSTSDNAIGDARYAEAQEVRSDAKYNLPAGAHILYSGDWNLFNGGYENSYRCLTGQTTSDGINWSDTSAIWANTNQTQAYDPMSKTTPPTTVTWTNAAVDNASYLYNDSTDAGTYCMSSRIDIQLPNAPMFGVYNSQGGVQLAPDTSDPYDISNFPSAKYPYAFETFGNNGSTPRGSTATSSANNSLDELTNTVPSAATVYADILLTGSGSSFTGSDHYPVIGDYNVVSTAPAAPVASFTGSPTNGTAPLLVTFTDTSTGSITNRFWNFGDSGTTNVTTNVVTHTYAAGTYSVMLVVSGSGGISTNSRSNYIVVTLPPPVASFTGSPTSGTEPLLVTFSDTSTGSITNRYWDFGDSSTTNVTTNSVAHTYAAGTYSVSLTVSGPGGTNTNTKANYITALTAFQAWQVQYFGSTTNPAAAANAAAPDGDGFTNLQDYLAGTDPTNSASALHITSIAPQGSDLLITWAMGSGKTNALQLSLGDGNGNYSNNFTDLFTVTNTVGSVTNYLDAGAMTNTPPRFYRVRLVP